MILPLLMAVAIEQFVEPVPINPERWISENDFPADAARAGDTGSVAFEVDIDQAGKPIRCRVLRPTSRPSFDKTACAAMVVRGRFKPALDARGTPIASSWRRAVNWGGDKRKALQKPVADLDLDLARMPKVNRDSVEVLQVESADGAVEGCFVKRSSGAPALDDYACKALAPVAVGDPHRGVDGKPERALRVRVVRFAGPPA